MGKTEALLNISTQLFAQGIVPIILSYHPDIDQRMNEALGDVQLLTNADLGYNPMYISSDKPNAHIDNAAMLRDIFSAVWPDLGDVQLSNLRNAIKWSYEQAGWGGRGDGQKATPQFSAFFDKLKKEERADKGLKTMLSRLEELNDYGLFDTRGDRRSLLSATKPCVVQLHENDNEVLQRAIAMFALHGIYGDMFRRGVQPRLTHAIIVDEAHRAARLKLLSKFAKEGRKFGISLILASQAVIDFDVELFSGIANYLLLRMNEQDAYRLAREIASSDQSRGIADRLKQMAKYHALFFQESQTRPSLVHLRSFTPIS
jgi:hypothetical protein